MFKFFFKSKGRQKVREEFLAPETRPIIYFQGSEKVIEKTGRNGEQVEINYKVVGKSKPAIRP